jgi:rod shape-determining protein MreC
MIRMFDRTRRVRLLLIVLIMVSLTIVTIDFRTKGEGPLDRIGHVALTVLSPIQHGLVKIFRPVGNFFAGFTQVPSLRAKVSDLQRANAELKGLQDQNVDILRENQNLRLLLHMAAQYNLSTMTAQVVGVSPSNFERTIFINVGSRKGIKKNMPVVAGEGLVGRVTSVSSNSAEVLLLIDRTSAVAARIAGTGETGLLEGDGSEDPRLELFNPDAKVKVGDRVVTSGYDRGLFPPGIPIGFVTAAPPAHSNLSRVARIQPYVDFSRLDYVLIVVGKRVASLPSPTRSSSKAGA